MEIVGASETYWRRTAGVTALMALAAVVAGCATQPPPEAPAGGGPPSVMRRGGMVWIEDVERLRRGVGQDDTLMGSLAAALRATDRSVTYDRLMGSSGAAFAVRFDRANWQPDSGGAVESAESVNAAMRAVGRSSELLTCEAVRPGEAARVRAAIVGSINGGAPAVAFGLEGSKDWGVIAGYRNEGAELLCRTYLDKSDGYSRADECPRVVVVIGERTGVPDLKAAAAESLATAVRRAKTGGSGQYTEGFAAYEAWAASLRDDSKLDALSKTQVDQLARANARCYADLVDARAAAVRYLRSVALLFNAEARDHLLKAISIYRSIVSRLQEGWQHVPDPRVGEGEAWTPEMRRSEADMLGEVLSLEKQAVDELERALGAGRAAVQA